MTSQVQARGLLALPCAVALVAPTPSAALHALSAPAADPVAPLLGAVALAAWAGACWLAVVVGCAWAGQLPGAAGRGARRVLRRLAPASVRALIRLAVGTAVAASVLPGPAALAQDRGPAVTAVAGSLDWPVAVPPAPAVAPAPAASSAPAPAAAPAVVVGPGDSLWRIAARDLGPAATTRQVAQAWPRWWEANRAVVGDDPDLIWPGTRLVPPTR